MGVSEVVVYVKPTHHLGEAIDSEALRTTMKNHPVIDVRQVGVLLWRGSFGFRP